MMIGAMFFGLVLVLCLAYFIFIKAWKQENVAFKVIGFVLVGLLILSVLCAPVCMLMSKNGMGGCCPGGNFNKKVLFRGEMPPGGPNMMWFKGNMPGGCPMMGGQADFLIKTDEKVVTEGKPGEVVTKGFEMPIWQRAVELMDGNDANIKSFTDKVKANPDLLKKLKDALAK
jgi:hypothetical protein